MKFLRIHNFQPKTGKTVINVSTHTVLFILVINQLDAQNLFYDKFISCLYIAPGDEHMVLETCRGMK